MVRSVVLVDDFYHDPGVVWIEGADGEKGLIALLPLGVRWGCVELVVAVDDDGEIAVVEEVLDVFGVVDATTGEPGSVEGNAIGIEVASFGFGDYRVEFCVGCGGWIWVRPR